MSCQPPTLLDKTNNFVLKNESVIIVVLCFLAFLWRVIYFLEIQHSPYGNLLTVDAKIHHEWAQQIAGGNLFFEKVFFRAPLYYYLLGFLYWIFGDSLDVARIFQILISTVSCLLIYYIVKKVFNIQVALIAFIISSFYGMYLYFSNELLFETLTLFLNLIGILLLLKALEGKHKSYWLVSGMAFGLSAITQPNILFFLACIPIWFYIVFQSKYDIGTIIKLVSFLAIGTLITVMPVTLYNYIVGNDVVLISSQGGVNFYMGNNPYSDGVSAAIPGVRNNWKGLLEDTDAIAKKKLNNPYAKPSEVSKYWSGKGWEYIFENPIQAVKSYLKKIYLFFNAHEIANNRPLYPMAGFSIIFTYLSIKFWFVFPLAVAGIFLALRNRKVLVFNDRKGFTNPLSGDATICKANISLQTLLIIFIVTYALSYSMFFVNMRFRLSVTPVLIIFASYSIYCWLTCLSKSVNAKEIIKDSSIRNSILIAVITALVVMPYKPQETYEYWQGVLELGQIYMDQHNDAGEKGIIEELKKAKPEYINSQPKLGSLYFTTLGKLYMVAYSDLDKSVENLKAALNIEPNNNEKYCDIGLVYFMAGKYVEAENYLKKTLEINPNNSRAKDFIQKIQNQK